MTEKFRPQISTTLTIARSVAHGDFASCLRVLSIRTLTLRSAACCNARGTPRASAFHERPGADKENCNNEHQPAVIPEDPIDGLPVCTERVAGVDQQQVPGRARQKRESQHMRPRQPVYAAHNRDDAPEA